MKKRRSRKRKLLPPYGRVLAAAILTAGLVLAIVSLPYWKSLDPSANAKSDSHAQDEDRTSDSSGTPDIDLDSTIAKQQSEKVAPTYNALPPAKPPKGISLPNTGGSQQETLPSSECPAPDFTLTVAQSSSSNRDLYIVAAPVANDPGSRAGCGGVDYSTPSVTYPVNGHFCDQLLADMASNAWSTDCDVQDGTSYGVYTFTFTVTGTNGYGFSSSSSKDLTYYYSS